MAKSLFWSAFPWRAELEPGFDVNYLSNFYADAVQPSAVLLQTFTMSLEQARKLAQYLMRLHKLAPQWSFRFDRSKVRFGKCNYIKKEISLSRYLVELNSEEEVRDTILHEIAHALAPRHAGHGPVWRSMALSIGCNARRCYGDEVVRPTPKYKGTCPSCNRVIVRHRRAVIACGRCTVLFDPKYAFVWS
jgi:SprT protein